VDRLPRKHPTAAVNFQAAMSERTAAFAPSVATTYDFSRMRRVVDVGGGRGTLLAAVLAGRTHLQGVVFDLPEGVAGATETLRAAGVANRCAIESGDFFIAVPSGADGYLLANVLHDWDDERSVAILRNCRVRGNPNNDDFLLSDVLLVMLQGESVVENGRSRRPPSRMNGHRFQRQSVSEVGAPGMSARRAFVYRYRVGGKERETSLGAFPELGLVEARERHAGHCHINRFYWSLLAQFPESDSINSIP
jgi:O-methyltransferase domain